MKSLVAVFLLLPPLGQAETLVRVQAEVVIQRLRKEGALVCFERVHNQRKDAITLNAQISALQKIPEKRRTETERDLLASLLAYRKRGKNLDTIVNWKQKQFDFDYPDGAANAAGVLDALVKADPDYQWERKGDRYLVYPKTGSFNRPLAGFKAEKLKFGDLLQAGREQVFSPAGLHYMEVIMGRSWTEPYRENVHTLVLGPTDAHSALTELCVTIGPKIVWSTMGIEPDSMNMSFGPVGK